MFKVLALVAFTAAVVMAQIPPAPVYTVWEGMFPPPYVQSPQIALAMDCVSGDNCYLAGGSNGVGFGVYQYDGKMEGQILKMKDANMSMFVTDLAVGGTSTNPKGAFTSIVDFTVGAGLQYLDNDEWKASQMPKEIVWASQSLASSNGAKNLVAVGNGFSNDLMISDDYGATFSPVALNFKAKDNCSAPAYIQTPADGAWYMTWAAQPARNNSNNANKKYYDETIEEVVGQKADGQVLIIRNKQTKEHRVHTKTLKQLRADRIEAAMDAENKCNYYDGYILKSTDQGNTWTQMYNIPNAATSFITCGSADNCVVTAFNSDESYTITTTDGTNFKVTYTTPVSTKIRAESLQAVAFSSETEVWAAGSMESQQSGAGMFWYSKDKGETWTVYPHTVPDVMAIMAVDFTPDGVGFAVGITMFKTAQIMRYKKQADYGFFVQSHCPIAGCSVLCQNVSFPQGMCLIAEGGSAKAFCTPQGVMQYNYETTSCVGSYKTNLQPINQCLNGTNTFFENYCPSSVDEIRKFSKPAGANDKLLH